MSYSQTSKFRKNLGGRGKSQPFTKSTMHSRTIDVVLTDVENDQEHIQRPKLALKLTIFTLNAQYATLTMKLVLKICKMSLFPGISQNVSKVAYRVHH